jgi:hypothetical protein
MLVDESDGGIVLRMNLENTFVQKKKQFEAAGSRSSLREDSKW